VARTLLEDQNPRELVCREYVIEGQRALELTMRTPHYMSERIWISTSTYLPLRTSVSFPGSAYRTPRRPGPSKGPTTASALGRARMSAAMTHLGTGGAAVRVSLPPADPSRADSNSDSSSGDQRLTTGPVSSPAPAGTLASAATPWEWSYINAVHLDTDGNLLISSRYTWTVYKVNLHTGKIIWELGGKQSTFKLKTAAGQVLDSAGEIFAYQHDPEAIGNDEYTLFDDESDGGGGLLYYSRVVVKLDLATKVATLVRSVKQPEGLLVTAEGNAQTTRNGDLFVGWGVLPYISEFSPTGQLLFNAQLPGLTSYRAYRLPWQPAS
jgi:hypothetical protein